MTCPWCNSPKVADSENLYECGSIDEAQTAHCASLVVLGIDGTYLTSRADNILKEMGFDTHRQWWNK